jgi:hypothetical protein
MEENTDTYKRIIRVSFYPCEKLLFEPRRARGNAADLRIDEGFMTTC